MSNAFTPSSDLTSALGRAAHDLGLAGMLGGQLFGRLALHPAVTSISSPGERGAVVNAAWKRYGAVNGAGLLAVGGGWLVARRGEVRDRNLVGTERTLARVKDGLVATLVVSGVAMAIEGVRFARQAPGGAVPMRDGDHVADGADAGAASNKRTLSAFGTVAIVSEIGIVVVNAALGQVGFRRSPLRRRLRRF